MKVPDSNSGVHLFAAYEPCQYAGQAGFKEEDHGGNEGAYFSVPSSKEIATAVPMSTI